MMIQDTFISGLKLIHLNEFKDERGSFIKVFNEQIFKENGLETNFKESYYSISAKDVIRGMHFQIPSAEHTKLVYVNQGRIIDVVLDIRKSSPTYGEYYTIELSSKSPILIYIPVGCAHGFLSKENNTMVTYLQSSCYNADCDKGIHYSSFGYEWTVEKEVVSTRDSNFVSFEQFNSPF